MYLVKISREMNEINLLKKHVFAKKGVSYHNT